MIIRPQPGYQEKVLSSPADICISGSGAGVGKTAAMLIEMARNIKVEGFMTTAFRRTTPQIRGQGGLWDASKKFYTGFGTPIESRLEWIFGKNKIKFAHLESDAVLEQNYQGTEIPLICFDELTHFTSNMFFYMLTRNRTTCGVAPYVRSTCNPDPDSWLANFVAWWIDQDTGFPIPERDGVLRYMIVYENEPIWGNTKAEVIKKAAFLIDGLYAALKEAVPTAKKEDLIKSVTFISGNIYENVELLKSNPEYLANLLSQPEDVRRRLLDGNWKYSLNTNDVFEYSSFNASFSNFFDVSTGKKRLVIDVALGGKDKLIIAFFDGRMLEDIAVVPKSSGKKVIEDIAAMARINKIPNNRIIYDADGLGGFIGDAGGFDGFIPGSIPYRGNGTPIEIKDKVSKKMIKESYKNLRSQMYFRAGLACGEGLLGFPLEVQRTKYDKKTTVKERLLFERRAIKKKKFMPDEKKEINSKAEQKVILGGQSPDLMDVIAMNEWFELQPDLVSWQPHTSRIRL